VWCSDISLHIREEEYYKRKGEKNMERKEEE
jgi:hypothetical protein